MNLLAEGRRGSSEGLERHRGNAISAQRNVYGPRQRLGA